LTLQLKDEWFTAFSGEAAARIFGFRTTTLSPGWIIFSRPPKKFQSLSYRFFCIRIIRAADYGYSIHGWEINEFIIEFLSGSRFYY